jgi:5-formyltetrahydrofolate cyclo-ligase
MDGDLREAKASLRQQMLAALARISAEARVAASSQACELLQRQRVWEQARSILFFAPISGEPDLWPLLQIALGSGKQVALPKYQKQSGNYAACSIKDLQTDVENGYLGIREPRSGLPQVPLNRLDFILVPGLSFDLHGGRLGRGKGFYDQLLAAVCGTTCGVAFDPQIVRQVPIEPHDVHVNCILTPTRWVEL